MENISYCLRKVKVELYPCSFCYMPFCFNKIFTIYTGPNLFTLEGNLRGGLGSGPL